MACLSSDAALGLAGMRADSAGGSPLMGFGVPTGPCFYWPKLPGSINGAAQPCSDGSLISGSNWNSTSVPDFCNGRLASDTTAMDGCTGVHNGC